MRFAIDVGGRRHIIDVQPGAGVDKTGGSFHVTRRRAAVDGRDDAPERIDVEGRLTDLGLSLRFASTGRMVDAAVTDWSHGQWLVQLPHLSLVASLAGPADAPSGGSGGDAQAQRICAPMPGRVLRVLVKPGDVVSPRQGLLVIEAMKMENELAAIGGGTVREVHVAEGMPVEAGRVLVVISHDKLNE